MCGHTTCGTCNGPHFVVMLRHDLWNQLTRDNTRLVLCFDCMERRLGRKITLADLLPCGITNHMLALLGLVDKSLKVPDQPDWYYLPLAKKLESRVSRRDLGTVVHSLKIKRKIFRIKAPARPFTDAYQIRTWKITEDADVVHARRYTRRTRRNLRRHQVR